MIAYTLFPALLSLFALVSSQRQMPLRRDGSNAPPPDNTAELRKQGLVPIYSMRDGLKSSPLLLHPDGRISDPAAYGNTGYQPGGRQFCISERPTFQAPLPLYAYRLDKGGRNYNHFYTTNAAEIGVIQAGQVGNYGYQCLGILGFVGSKDTVSKGQLPMIPIWRWYSGSLNQHRFDAMEVYGNWRKDYQFEGNPFYVYRCP